jgi:hypothetical protein
MELTQAQRILLDSMNKMAAKMGYPELALEDFKDSISNEEHNGHEVAFLMLEAMETYGKAKWEEACNTIRENHSNSAIMHSFFVEHVNPEFKA